MAQRNAFSI